MQKGLFNILDDAYCLLMQPADYLCVFIQQNTNPATMYLFAYFYVKKDITKQSFLWCKW